MELKILPPPIRTPSPKKRRIPTPLDTAAFKIFSWMIQTADVHKADLTTEKTARLIGRSQTWIGSNWPAALGPQPSAFSSQPKPCRRKSFRFSSEKVLKK